MPAAPRAFLVPPLVTPVERIVHDTFGVKIMIDTIRFSISDSHFYSAVCTWRQNDLNGTVPARINCDALRAMIDDGKIIDFEQYKDKKLRDLLDDLNEHGLDVVIKDFFQLQNQGSWCRDITCIIDEWNRCIMVELSLPKFVNGQNVDLLYDYRVHIIDFLNYIYLFFRLPAPSVETILKTQISRIDFCYYYKFASQIHALDFIRSFKYWAKHKRKKVHFYETSIMFVGSYYSLKFYMKHDEFQAHDKKEILKNIGSLLDASDMENRKEISDYTDLIAYCDSFSLGMVRSEFTVRKKKLNYDGLYTLQDLFGLEIVSYYEKLLDRMGVLKMGHTGKNEIFNKLKSDKKLIQYAALVETFGKDKVREMYSRNSIYKYDKMLTQLGIYLNDLDILREINLSVREDDIARIAATADNYELALKFANGELF